MEGEGQRAILQGVPIQWKVAGRGVALLEGECRRVNTPRGDRDHELLWR